ncbi:MAG: TraR/DksA C4-type zinc finger protein [Actinomycetota bacterium]|nr:TraR/DksA C4-type zinc finger protein [Actinomycetota bacterium]
MRAGAAARKVVGRSTAGTSTTSARSGTKKPATKKPAATKSPAKKSPAKKATRATAKKSPAKKATRATATKAPAEKATAKKATAKKATATKATATKAPAKKAPAKATGKKAPAKKTLPTKPPAKKVPARKARRGSAGALVVLAGESAWTAAELGEVRTHLRGDIKRLEGELHLAEEDLAGLMRDAGDGAGNDQADVGSASFERDQEMVIANNARDMLTQSEHALERIANGTYGVCENCGRPIGKQRLMVFPRATLCLSCKQREERR